MTERNIAPSCHDSRLGDVERMVMDLTNPAGSPDAEPTYPAMMPIAAPEYRPTPPRWREDVRAIRLAVWPGVLGLLALAVSACFTPHAPRGVPCSIESKSCPDEQACVAGFCGGPPAGLDAAVDALPDAFIDSDNDGIDDSIDNCRDKPNHDQADEDKDGVGDACDPCPIDKDNSDPDGDGVGGICDPHPSTPGDKIVAFEPFNGAIQSTWRVTGNGTVTVNSDGEGVFTNAAGQTTRLVSPAGMTFGNGMIMANAVVDTTPGATRTALTVGLPYNSGTDVGIQCQLHAPDPNSTAGRELSLFDSKAPGEPANNQFIWATNTAYRLTMVRSGAMGNSCQNGLCSYACSMTDVNGVVKAANGSTGSIPAVSEVVLVASGTNAHVAWVLVVSSP
jgi:hypothetical protein